MWIGRLEIIPVLVLFRTIGEIFNPKRRINQFKNDNSQE